MPASRRGTVWALRFSPDGRFLVAAGEGQPLLPWDLEANTPIPLPSNVEPAPHSPVTFSPDGRFLALESAEALLLWDLSEGRLLASLDAGAIPALVDLAIEPDGGALVALAVDGSVHRWVLGAGAPTHTTARLPVDWYEDPRQGAYKAIAFSPHGRHMALVECAQELMIVGVCLRGQLKVWQLAAGAPSLLIAEDLDGDFEGQPGLSFSDDGRPLWTWGDYRQRYLWDLAPPAPLSSALQGAQATSLSSGTDLQKLVFHRGTLWDLAQKKPVERFPFPVTGALEAVAWSEDGRVLAECQKDAQGQRVVSRWETDTWELIHRFELPSTAGRVLFSPDLQTAILQTGQHVALWDAQEGNPLGVLSCTSDIYEVVVSQDGRLFAYNCWSEGVHLREIRTGEAIRVIEDTPLTIAFSPDGQTLAVGEEELRLWHTGTGAEKGPALDVIDGMARISDVAFSPDGSYLAIADIFGGLQLWDAVSYHSIHRLRPSAMPEDYGYSDDSDYTYVAFTPDGQHLLSAGPYQVPLVWDVGQGALTARICRIANRNLTHREWSRYVDDEPYRRTCPDVPLPED